MSTPRWLTRLFVSNGSLKLLAFGLALALFFWVREDRDSTLTGSVPLHLIIPEGMVLVSEPVERVRVTVGGRWSDLNKFDPSQIKPIRLDIDRNAAGSVGISSDLVQLPPGVRVTTIHPSFVHVELEPAVTKRIDVRVRRVGEPAESFQLGDIEVTPHRIEVTGPQSSIDNIDHVWTESIDVSDRTETFERRVHLRIDDAFLQYDVDQPINVRVPITAQEVTRTFQGVAVVGMNTSYEVNVHPSVVSVTVHGPKPIVDKITSETLYAAVDLTVENRQPPGRFDRTATIYNMPDRVQLVQFHPTNFLVTTTRAEPDTPNE